MFVHIFLSFGTGVWFAPQRWGSAVSGALMFAHVVGFTVLVARDVPRSLIDNWPVWKRLLVSSIGGGLMGTLAWWTHSTLFLFNTTPDWAVLLLGGTGLSIGFVLAGVKHNQMPIHLIGTVILTSIAIYLPIFAAFQQFQTSINASSPAMALLYFSPRFPQFVYMIGIPFALCIAVFGHLPDIWQALRKSQAKSSHHEAL